METLYRKVAVSERLPEKKGYFDTDVGNIYFLKKTWQPSEFLRKAKVNKYHEDYFEEPEYWLEPIPDPTTQLKADKEELLHFLKYFKQCVEDEDFIMVNNTDEDVADNVLSKMNSLIQKHKQ